jgi:hypothetical protein
VCFRVRDDGINLDWSATLDGCRRLEGAKGHDASQWRLMPPAGSTKRIGDPIDRGDRFALHNVVAGQRMVKCARIYNGGELPTWRAADLKWSRECMPHELIWTHRALLTKLGEDAKKLALQRVPESLRSMLEGIVAPPPRTFQRPLQRG